MYVLKGNILVRGFSLVKDNSVCFRTRHRFGAMPGSTVTIRGDRLSVKRNNLLGDKWDVFKGDAHVGRLDFSNYLYSSIALNRHDGIVDVFKLEQQGYAELYILSKSGTPIMSFDLSLNPFYLEDRYKVSIVSDAFPDDVLEELMFYVGEMLFRKVSLQSARV